MIRLWGDRTVEGSRAVMRQIQRNAERRRRAEAEASAATTSTTNPAATLTAATPTIAPTTSADAWQAPILLPVETVLARKRAAMIAARPRGWRPTEQHEPARGGA